MINHPPSDQLLSFIWLLAFVAGVAWCLMAHPLRVAPKASFRFFAANLALGIGIYLLTLHTADSSLLSWFFADMAILSNLNSG